MASAASVTPVWSALGDVLLAPQVCGAVAPVSRSAEYLYVVYEIAARHNLT